MRLLYILLPNDQCVVIIVEGQVAVLITKAINVAGLGDVFIGEVAEFEASFQQSALMDSCFPFGVKQLKNSPVFAQDGIDRTNKMGPFTVDPVVKGAAALIRAKAFVRPSAD